MSRVLISFLGTGNIKPNGKSDRDYKTTKYRVGNNEYECSFISVALKKHLNVDKLILIGTTHSMWEEVYLQFSENLDDGVHEEICNGCSQSDYKSPLQIPHKEKIEEAMGKGSKVVLVKYGINADEIRENSDIILGLEKVLEKGDELYVDISHSFRSLPLYIMNLLIYLRDVSPKKIKISGIYYGMFEVYKQLNYAPIVDLSETLNVNSWISGAYSFMEFGNAYKIVSLLDSDRSIRDVEHFTQPLKGFSDAKNLNHLSELENQVATMIGLKRRINNLPLIAQMVIEPVLGSFLDSVKLNDGKYGHSNFQYQLAVWHKKNHNYAASYISLNEAIVTRACEKWGFDSTLRNSREDMKAIFKSASEDVCHWTQVALKNMNREDVNKYSKLYGKVSYNRNAIAHSLKATSIGEEKRTVVGKIIKELEEFINEYNKLPC